MSGFETPPLRPKGMYPSAPVANKHNVLDRKEIVSQSKAFTTQSGGTHYTDLQLQPLEATYLRYGLVGLKAALHTKIDKYITRQKDDEIGQLKKAHHCLSILLEITELEKANG